MTLQTKLHFFLLLALAASMPAVAQPTAFSYTGHFIDNDQPANGNYDLQFALYDADAGGNVVAGPISASSVAVGPRWYRS